MMDYAARVAQADTYPKLLRLNAREHGGEIALREKDFGLWRTFTWNDVSRFGCRKLLPHCRVAPGRSAPSAAWESVKVAFSETSSKNCGLWQWPSF